MRLARFASVGLATNAIYFAALAVCQLALHTPLWLGAALAYGLSAVFNYLAQRRYTFQSDAAHSAALPKYIVVQGVALALNSLILEVLVTRIGLHYLLAQGLALVATTAWSYVAQRAWVFSRSLPSR